jgi:hypothetical protein
MTTKRTKLPISYVKYIDDSKCNPTSGSGLLDNTIDIINEEELDIVWRSEQYLKVISTRRSESPQTKTKNDVNKNTGVFKSKAKVEPKQGRAQMARKQKIPKGETKLQVFNLKNATNNLKVIPIPRDDNVASQKIDIKSAAPGQGPGNKGKSKGKGKSKISKAKISK